MQARPASKGEELRKLHLPSLGDARRAFRRVRAPLRGRTGIRDRDVQAVVACPECGERRVPPRDVTVRVCVDIDHWSYRFTCPTCRRRSVAVTSRVAALRAVERGVPLETWSRPADIDLYDFDGPPLTPVDLLELRVSLSEPHWFDALVNGTGEPEQ